MKVILVNADEKGTFYASHGQSWGHLGLLFVGTVLEQEGFEIVLWDELIMGDAPLEMLVQPGDIVGLSLVVTGVERGVELARQAKKLGARFVLAGNDQAAFRAQQMLRLGIFDGIFTGDDLAPVRTVFRSIRNTGRFPADDVSGFARRGGHEPSITIRKNAEYFIVPNLKLFPQEHWNLVWQNHRVRNGFEYSGPDELRNSLILFGGGCSRGVNTCPYCSIGEVSNIRKPQHDYLRGVVTEYEKFGINDFFNVTDSFYEMSSVIKMLMGLGVTFPNLTLYARAWGLSHRPENAESLLSLIEPSGILKFNIGLDSGDDRTLRNGIQKGHGLKENQDAIALLKKLGIHLHCSFVFGAPGETRETCERTMDFIQFVVSELGQQLSQVESDIWWVNFGAPCSQIFNDYNAALKYANLAGKTISKEDWQNEFACHQEALFIPWSVEQAWYRYFTNISPDDAQGYVETTMNLMRKHQILTGRGFGGHPYRY